VSGAVVLLLSEQAASDAMNGIVASDAKRRSMLDMECSLRELSI